MFTEKLGGGLRDERFDDGMRAFVRFSFSFLSPRELDDEPHRQLVGHGGVSPEGSPRVPHCPGGEKPPVFPRGDLERELEDGCRCRGRRRSFLLFFNQDRHDLAGLR